MLIPGIAAVAPDANQKQEAVYLDELSNKYTCPQNQTLTTNGNGYLQEQEYLNSKT